LAFIFKWLGVEVIYEVQENLYKKIPTKTYNKNWIFERLFCYFDQRARRAFRFVFTEDAYLHEYQNLAKPYAIVHNFADEKWLQWPAPEPDFMNPTFFYAGVISFERGFATLVEAIVFVKKKYPKVCVRLFGFMRFSNERLAELSGYDQVKNNLIFGGYVSQNEAFEHTKNAIAGIALLKPIGDYADSYPSKLFDYMALGLPVLASDLSLLKAVIEPNQCGFCVSAYDAEALAEKMIVLIENPDLVKRMGQNGRKAVKEQYNWVVEAQKMRELYQTE